MSIKTKDEILTSMKEIIGDRNDDTVLTLLADVSDTYDDFEAKVSDSTDWKTKYETNDAEWRNKFKERFFDVGSGDDSDPNELPEDEGNKNKPMKFEDLFETKKG